MNREELRGLFSDLGVWQRAGERAPYKPLLLLYTLGRYASGYTRLITFEDLDKDLLPLFRTFGPPRSKYSTVYPFWYLQNDGVWELDGAEGLMVREGKSGEPTKSSLLAAGTSGGLTPSIFSDISSDPRLLWDIAGDLLEAHFPESLHEEILEAVGLISIHAPVSAKRDPKFRQHVLVAYGYRCTVCGFDARLGDSLVGVEAAHIKWHQAGGPSTVDNGLAMCSLHHKLFDRGAFTLTQDRKIEVSQEVNGGPATTQFVASFHTHLIAAPHNPAQLPSPDFIEWHRNEVFREPGIWME